MEYHAQILASFAYISGEIDRGPFDKGGGACRGRMTVRMFIEGNGNTVSADKVLRREIRDIMWDLNRSIDIMPKVSQEPKDG